MLILLDIQLPLMDGCAVAREWRNHPASRDIPIIAATSHAMVGVRDKSLATDCKGYFEKPINPDAFVTEIGRFLAPKQKEERRDPSADSG